MQVYIKRHQFLHHCIFLFSQFVTQTLVHQANTALPITEATLRFATIIKVLHSLVNNDKKIIFKHK